VYLIRLIGRAFVAFWNDNGPRMGASLAYYTLFALAPILLIAIAVAGVVFGPDAVRGEVVAQIDDLVGTQGAEAVQALLQGAARDHNTTLATTVGIVTLVLAATGAFLELQASFNTIWRATPTPRSRVKDFLLDRARSFGLVVAIGFLLLVSLAVTAALAAFGSWLTRIAPGAPLVMAVLNWVVSFAVITGLFALLFKFLPEVPMAWRDALAGAAVTGVLFTIGKQLIGLYLGRSATASAYGAAGSVILLLLWVYYSSQIVLLGAEFTRLYGEDRRSHRNHASSIPAQPDDERALDVEHTV
jgi:membrane protein